MASRIEGSGSRAHSLRLQRIIAKVRRQDSIATEPGPVANESPPARRAAEHAGVGDNLGTALTNVHTEGSPMAPSFIQSLSKDYIVGDGNIEPDAVLPSGDIRPAARRGSAVRQALAAAEKTSAALVATGSLAARLHAGDSGTT